MVRKRAGLLETDDEASTRLRLHQTVVEWVPDPKDRDWVEPALLTLLGLEPAPAGGRDVLFAAWRIFFERVASRGTTVLLFEDLQWADDGQLDFIDHVMEWAKGVPLLVVTLARPDLLERRPGWGTSARSFNTIGLEPLTSANMRALVKGLVPEMPDAAVESILTRADGIPLYAVETVRMLIADGRLTATGDGTFRPTGELGELAIPDSLRALVAARLDGLDDADRTLLQDAAVLGKTFGSDALAAIYGQDEAELEPRLRALARGELLEVSVDPASPERGQYGFVQSVIREVAYDTLSRRDRRVRHLAAARYFEGLGEDELAGVLSTHYLAAFEASEPGPESDALRIQARLALRGAAARAMDLGAAGQAQALLRTALEITDEASERADLLERAAVAADIEGRYEDAERLGFEAVAAYEEAGDRTGAARMSATQGGILVDASKLTETVEFLEVALAKADRPEDEEMRADMLARLSRAHMRLGQPEQAVARADEALAIAEPRHLGRIVAEAFVNKGAALGSLQRIKEPVVLVTAAVEMAHELGDVALELRARNNLGAVYGNDDGNAAMRTAREAYELATRLGVRQMATWIAGALGWGATYEGLDWDAALARLDTEIELALAGADRGRLIAVRESIMAWRGEASPELTAQRRQLLADISDPDVELWDKLSPAARALVLGHYAEATRLYARASQFQGQNTTDARFGYLLAAHYARDLEAARGAREALADEPFAGTFVDAMQLLADAGVAALEDRPDEAVAGYRSAIAKLDASGSRFSVAQVQLDALITLPDEPSIEAWVGEARERFETVKSVPLLERLDEAVAIRSGMRTATTTVERTADEAIP